MQLLERLPTKVLTLRGWGLIAFGVLALLFAQFLGRRDLLYLGILLLALPLLAVLVLRLIKPGFTVERTFSPQTVETGTTTTVRLAVRSSGSSGGVVTMQERLPARFGDAPGFHFPSRHPTPSGTSLYEYRLRSSARGVYDVGPVTAGFTDPFGLGKSRHTLGATDRLLVSPAPLELPQSPLTGSRGTDGNAVTRRRANPSDDDVMTREYRHGDPMRRVHWAATARHSELMVRQEESVTTPEATLILDQRQGSFSSNFLAAFGYERDPDGSGLLTAPAFEWAVTAVMSISAHLLERSYVLRFLDQNADPALRRSPSAPWPDDDEYLGQAGIQNIAEGLAALQLVPDPKRSGTAGRPFKPRTTAAGGSAHSVHSAHAGAFGDPMMDKLAGYRHHGPLIAVLGTLTPGEARSLALASEFGSSSFAMLVSDRPQEAHPVMEILRGSGWNAVAVSPSASLASAWASSDSPVAATTSTAKTTLGTPLGHVAGTRP